MLGTEFGFSGLVHVLGLPAAPVALTVLLPGLSGLLANPIATLRLVFIAALEADVGCGRTVDRSCGGGGLGWRIRGDPGA